MPLRDHFRPPLSTRVPWDALHGGWPMKIVEVLGQQLPPNYLALPLAHLGASFEVDVATYDFGRDEQSNQSSMGDESGGVATATGRAVWAPPRPSISVAGDSSVPDEYEVRFYDEASGRRLVAVVEIVSPLNKDRPESRQAFVAKCDALLRKGVCVAIVDVVTTRAANLYRDLLEIRLSSDPQFRAEPPATYAATCRWTSLGETGRLDAWAYRLEIGKPLPTLPLWLAPGLAVPLELEESYEATCKALRIGELSHPPAAP